MCKCKEINNTETLFHPLSQRQVGKKKGRKIKERTEEVIGREMVYRAVLYLQAVFCSSDQWKENGLGKNVESYMRCTERSKPEYSERFYAS